MAESIIYMEKPAIARVFTQNQPQIPPNPNCTYEVQLGLGRIEVEDFILERARGIEPPSPAWEAGVLPLNHARSNLRLI